MFSTSFAVVLFVEPSPSQGTILRPQLQIYFTCQLFVSSLFGNNVEDKLKLVHYLAHVLSSLTS